MRYCEAMWHTCKAQACACIIGIFSMKNNSLDSARIVFFYLPLLCSCLVYTMIGKCRQMPYTGSRLRLPLLAQSWLQCLVSFRRPQPVSPVDTHTSVPKTSKESNVTTWQRKRVVQKIAHKGLSLQIHATFRQTIILPFTKHPQPSHATHLLIECSCTSKLSIN